MPYCLLVGYLEAHRHGFATPFATEVSLRTTSARDATGIRRVLANDQFGDSGESPPRQQRPKSGQHRGRVSPSAEVTITPRVPGVQGCREVCDGE
jgi:hypothetical protein